MMDAKRYLVKKSLYQEATKRNYEPGEIVFIGDANEAQILIDKLVVEEYNTVEAGQVYTDDDELDKLPRRL